jgi:tetratricopeptide (TPR) repeat protein
MQSFHGALVCGMALLLGIQGLLAQTTDTRGQVEAHAHRAAELLQAKHPDLAANELRAILKLDPNNADAHANLGVLIFFQPDYAKAAPELRAALRLRPELTKIQALLGLCEIQLGEIGPAKEDLAQSFPRLPEEKLRVETGMRLTELYYSGGQLEQAAGVIGELRKLHPTDPDILYAAQRVYADLADACMLSVAMAAPDSARMRQLMGNEMARRGNVEGAIAEYREALKKDPKLPGLRFQLAEMLSLSPVDSDRKQAEQEYRQSLEGNPMDVRAECRLGEIALNRSDVKEALARYAHALKLRPEDAEANLGMAKALMGSGQTAKAEPYLKQAIASEPFDATAHMRLAAVYRATGHSADAAREVAEFQRLRDMKTRLGDVYREMSVQLPAAERKDEESAKQAR